MISYYLDHVRLSLESFTIGTLHPGRFVLPPQSVSVTRQPQATIDIAVV